LYLYTNTYICVYALSDVCPLSGSGLSSGARLVFVKPAFDRLLFNETHAWCLCPLSGSGFSSGARLEFVKPAYMLGICTCLVSVPSVWVWLVIGCSACICKACLHAGYLCPLSGSGLSSGARPVFVKPGFGRLLFNTTRARCLLCLSGSGVLSGARLVFVKPLFGRLSFLIQTVSGAGVLVWCLHILSGLGGLSLVMKDRLGACILHLGLHSLGGWSCTRWTMQRRLMYILVCIYIYTYMHVCIDTHINIYIYIYMLGRIYMYICIV
jgi:hypothetical protein